MHGVKISPGSAPPSSMDTLGDALASMVYEHSQMSPNERRKRGDDVRKARATAAAISQLLGKEDWKSIPLASLIGIDASLVRLADEEGNTKDKKAGLAVNLKQLKANGARYARNNRNRYMRNCRLILNHAIEHGFTCEALERVACWEPIIAPFKGEPRGLVRILKDLGMRKALADATEDDLEAARLRAVANGLAESTSEHYLITFRAKIRALNLESMLPRLDFTLHRRQPYCDAITEMTAEKRAELDGLVNFISPAWVPDRDAKYAVGPDTVERMCLSFRELDSYARKWLPRDTLTLRELVVPEIVVPWIDYLDARGLPRQSVSVVAGPIHSIARKVWSSQQWEFDWILDKIARVPMEPSYERRMRKQTKSERYEVLHQMVEKLREASRDPRLTVVEVAWLRHDESLISTLLQLALRQSNQRSIEMQFNLVEDYITVKMARELDLPEDVRAEWDKDHHRSFLMLTFSEAETKSKRAEKVVLPLALAEDIQDFKWNHRPLLIDSRHDHGKLWFNRQRGVFSQTTFRRLILRITKEHIGKAIPPHLWRSIFCSHVMCLAAAGMGGGMKQAQHALFHADEMTTQIYNDLDYALPGILAMDRKYASPPPTVSSTGKEQ